jgi:hypothetical protein
MSPSTIKPIFHVFPILPNRFSDRLLEKRSEKRAYGGRRNREIRVLTASFELRQAVPLFDRPNPELACCGQPGALAAMIASKRRLPLVTAADSLLDFQTVANNSGSLFGRVDTVSCPELVADGQRAVELMRQP